MSEAARFERLDGRARAFAPARPHQEITSLEQWRDFAPPFAGPKHWVDGRSAKETAKACCADGIAAPPALLALLDSHPCTSEMQVATVLPEWRTSLTDRGGPRRHDLLLLGTARGQRTVVGVEAKTDEPFDDPLARRVRKAQALLDRGTPTRQLDRLDLLTRAAFGKSALANGEIRPELARVPYQLLAGLAGTLIEASARGAGVAAFCVLGFRHEQLDHVKLEGNSNGFSVFLQQLAGEQVEPVDGQLSGPHVVPGADGITGGEILVGAVTQTL
jgi:hypothetical protein